MDAINISNWNNKQVLDWFKGLDESLQRYYPHFERAEVVGEQLLSLTHDDLLSLQIQLVGHQELILDAVALLQQLDYGLDTETLQSRALCLKCRCRSLRSSIATRRREAEEYGYEAGISLQSGASNQMLHLAADVLVEGKQLVLWLDRAPFSAKKDFKELRHMMVKLCYELSVTMQQSVFACVIEDATLSICDEIENLADGIVQSNEPLTIQPVTLEILTLRDVDPKEGLGLFIKVTFEGHHVVTGTRSGSVASKARRITSGDEVVAVNGKAVIGWSLGSLVSSLKEHPHQVSLLMKKRPQNASSSSSNLLALMQRQEQNDRSRQMRTSAPVKRISLPASALPPGLREDSRTPPPPAGSWSRDRQVDTSLDRISNASGNGYPPRGYSKSINSIESNNSSSNARYSSSSNSSRFTPAERSRQSSLLRGGGADSPLISSSLHEEPASPINLLNLPPPPAEPYLPKGDPSKLMVDRHDATKRSQSPNSMLDTEHQRRHTVIGDSMADEAWFEDLLHQVNRSSIAPPGGRRSHDPISSSEDVFLSSATPHSSASSIARRQHPANEDAASLAKVQQRRRSQPARRPLSMPPNYYNQVKLDDATQRPREQLRPLNSQTGSRATPGSQSKRSAEDLRRSRYTSFASHTSSGQRRQLPATQNQPRHYYSNSNSDRFYSYNSNNSNSAALVPGTSPPRPIARPRPSTAPKPPPRSSSITKLSHRNSADVSTLHQVCHPRQASLPTDSTVTRMSSEFSPSSLQKPSPPDKPASLHSLLKSKVSSKRSKSSSSKKRSKSTSSSAILSSSLEKRDDGNQQAASASPTLNRINLLKSELRNHGMKVSVRGAPPTGDPATGNSPGGGSPVQPRPVPAPRRSLKRNKSADPLPNREETERSLRFARSHSQDTTLDGAPLAKSSTPNERKSSSSSTLSHSTSGASYLRADARINGLVQRLHLSKQDHDYVNQPKPAKPQWRSPLKSDVTSLPFKRDITTSPTKSDVISPAKSSASSPSRSPQTSRVSYNAAIQNMGEIDLSRPSPPPSQRNKSNTQSPDNNYEVKIVAGVPVRLRKSLARLKGAQKFKDAPDRSRVGNFLTAEMKSQRRISCRDLGRGDCEGWLWKKKTGGTGGAGSGPLAQKWSKRWVVIKEGGVYCYRSNADDDDRRAESYISLPGYKVAPAMECKRKLAFRITHPKRKTFFFAAERQMDMSKWMNKMALASIEYFDAPTDSTDAAKSKEDIYFSESDDESRSTGDRSSTDIDKTQNSGESSPEKSLQLPADDNDDLLPSLDDAFYTKQGKQSTRHQSHSIEPPISAQPNGIARTRSQSDSFKQNLSTSPANSLASSSTSLSVPGDIGSLPPSPSRVRPNVNPDKRRHKGAAKRNVLAKSLSKSLDSLSGGKTGGDQEEEESKLRKVKELAAERAKDIRMRQASSVSSSPQIRVETPPSSPAPLIPEESEVEIREQPRTFSSATASALANIFTSKKKRKKRKSTGNVAQSEFFIRPQASDVESLSDREGPASLKPGQGMTHASSSPSLTTLSTNQASPSSPRRDAAGRPKRISPGDSPRRASSPIPDSSEAQEAAAALSKELNEKRGIDELFSAIKRADVDIRGVERRVTLRRKMTVLHRDPLKNEKMLKKRALQRELKAKELELEYYQEILSTSVLTSELLHDWINQHPSLVADMTTIRRMSGKRRPRADSKSSDDRPPGGDGDTSSEASVSLSKEPSDNLAAAERNINNNNNNNNNVIVKRASAHRQDISRNRPRSWAMNNGHSGDFGEQDRDRPGSGARNPAKRMSSSPIKSDRLRSHARKIASHRPMSAHADAAPYLETDL